MLGHFPLRANEPDLAKILEQLRAEDALEGVGYSSEDINALLDDVIADLAPGEIDDPGPGLPPEEPVTRPGDLWLLGEGHRGGNRTKRPSAI